MHTVIVKYRIYELGITGGPSWLQILIKRWRWQYYQVPLMHSFQDWKSVHKFNEICNTNYLFSHLKYLQRSKYKTFATVIL